VAVPEDRDDQPVREFEAYTADLYRLADWLTACGVKSVAMESTGVYWIPLFQILEERDQPLHGLPLQSQAPTRMSGKPLFLVTAVLSREAAVATNATQMIICNVSETIRRPKHPQRDTFKPMALNTTTTTRPANPRTIVSAAPVCHAGVTIKRPARNSTIAATHISTAQVPV